MIDAALLAMIAKDRWRQLAAGVAIDATGIDIKIAGNIFRKPLVNVCHY
jgi:hypothetical protein